MVELYPLHKTLSSSHLFLHVLFNVSYPILYSQKSRRSLSNALYLIRVQWHNFNFCSCIFSTFSDLEEKMVKMKALTVA